MGAVVLNRMAEVGEFTTWLALWSNRFQTEITDEVSPLYQLRQSRLDGLVIAVSAASYVIGVAPDDRQFIT